MDAIVDAARWIEHLMLGPVATALAVVGIALVGMMMLQGRIDWRRGATVCMGCFLVFGAPTIATNLAAVQTGEQTTLDIPVTKPDPPVEPPKNNANYDPYAGASLPQ